jgi:hypothetical protein
MAIATVMAVSPEVQEVPVMSSAVPRLHVEIDHELHRRAKIAGARVGLTMKALITEAVERLVADVEAEKDDARAAKRFGKRDEGDER